MGGVTLRAVGAPGHTPGSVCYLLERGGRRLLFSGDVIMSLVGDPKSRSLLRRPLGRLSLQSEWGLPGWRGRVWAPGRRLPGRIRCQ